MKPLPHGVIVIDKPAGPSSFGVVKVVRRLLQVKKVGHLGTLDPFADRRPASLPAGSHQTDAFSAGPAQNLSGHCLFGGRKPIRKTPPALLLSRSSELPAPEAIAPLWPPLWESNGRPRRSFPPCIFRGGACINGPDRESAWTSPPVRSRSWICLWNPWPCRN